MSSFRRFQIVRSKFSPSTTKQLLQTLSHIDWSKNNSQICKQINSISAQQNQQNIQIKYVWIVGANPSYFIQYQNDSYAVFKCQDKVVLVWKPKYLEYPSIVKLSQFGQNPKIVKSMQVIKQQKYGNISQDIQQKLANYVKMYYGMHYFSSQSQQTFQKNLLTQIKHHLSRISKQSYWHCVLDNHNRVDCTSKRTYLKLRIKGVKQGYDKDLIIFSQKGIRQFILKGKGLQIVSFLAMLCIFIAVISCPSVSEAGMCYYKDQMIFGGAVVMMGLLGMRVVKRNKFKKNLDKKIEQIQKKQQ